jgi:hypothetical protein
VLLVELGHVCIPISGIHLIETVKQSTEHRPDTVRRVLGLCRNSVLVEVPWVIAAEWHAYRGVGSVRDRLIVDATGPMSARGGDLARFFQLAAENLDDAMSDVVRMATKTDFGAAAGALDQYKQIPLDYVRTQIATALQMIGADSEIRRATIPASEEEFAVAFPSVGFQRYFYDLADSLEPNDIADLSFISRTVPYFDVVAVDRRMHDRLHAMRRRVPAVVRDALFRAQIVRTVAHVLEIVEKRVTE